LNGGIYLSGKVVVSVNVKFDVFGQITPLSFYWESGREYEISKVLERKRAVSFKSGGTGMRYTCKVDGKLVYLFYDDTVWYFER
jgi:hypothetical protein